MDMTNQSRILLVLDIDETLIHATEKPLSRPADFVVYGYHVYRRPHLDSFLQNCADHFELAVWSSASDEYVSAITELIFPEPSKLHFVWGRSRASLRRIVSDDGYFSDPWNHRHYTKPLAKLKRLGWPLSRILIVDDTPEKSALNYGNAIYPSPFEGAEADDELLLLSSYLTSLKDVPNVRTIEKRRWREAVKSPQPPLPNPLP